MADLNKLKEKLDKSGAPKADTKKFMAYIADTQSTEVTKDKKPVTNNTVEALYSLFLKYRNLGLIIDGVNVVITGRNMAMVTFNGYKNKVLDTYPETEFDYGLIRENDLFNLSKESFSVKYTHKVADPFSSTAIKGAYVMFKNKRGEYIELLNNKDYEAMKKASKQSYLWNTWDSEFWLKSVIKRACKRNFYDVVAEIDKTDNDDYGIADTEAAERGELDSVLDKISKAKDEDALTDIVTDLSAELQKAVTKQASDKFKELSEK
jgi:hypothetical protein